MIWLILLIVVAMLAAAVYALLARNPVTAVVSVSVVSLGLSLLFVILRAPDVAMTEVAIGAGLGGIILALALRKLGLARLESGDA
ncbi:MAG: Na(+)/H(+) antiporter subunit B [Gammaproteobacteria bacterium]